VLTNFRDKDHLAKAMGTRLRADRTGDGDDQADIERDVARSYARLTEAPVLIVVCLTMIAMDTYPDPQRSRHEWVMAAQSTAMASQNLLLQAHAEGLAACWVCAPLFVPELVGETLGLPSDWESGDNNPGLRRTAAPKKPRAVRSAGQVFVATFGLA
jgi:F420 biosynthesis protein FbiB-like protein